MSKLLIIGASGHGKVIADIAYNMNKWDEINFLDDNDEIKSSIGYDVIGKSSDMQKYIKDYDYFVAIGNNNIRTKIQSQLEMLGANIATLIHPSTIIGKQVTIGIGVAIMAGVIINCCSKIGKGAIINTGVTIDHDCNISDYVHLSPGVHLAGTVSIGSKTWIGIGSTVSNNLDICSNCVIGAGSVVIKSINKEGTYVGVPAKALDKPLL